MVPMAECGWALRDHIDLFSNSVPTSVSKGEPLVSLSTQWASTGISLIQDVTVIERSVQPCPRAMVFGE